MCFHLTIYGVQRAPPRHRAVESQWPSAPMSCSLSSTSWSISGYHWGVGTRGWCLSDAQTHSDVYVFACRTRVHRTQLYMCLVFVMRPPMRPNSTMSPAIPIMCVWRGGGEKGHRWWNMCIIHTLWCSAIICNFSLWTALSHYGVFFTCFCSHFE